MGLNLHRGVKALINVVTDSGITMHQRIAAAATLMEVNVPEPVADACRRFLIEIAENKEGIPGYRLAAARAVLRRDLGKYKRLRIKPLKYDPLRGMRDVTAAEMIENGLRRTEERDRQLRLISSTETPTEDAG
jgi:hypothetical protein